MLLSSFIMQIDELESWVPSMVKEATALPLVAAIEVRRSGLIRSVIKLACLTYYLHQPKARQATKKTFERACHYIPLFARMFNLLLSSLSPSFTFGCTIGWCESSWIIAYLSLPTSRLYPAAALRDSSPPRTLVTRQNENDDPTVRISLAPFEVSLGCLWILL